MQCFGREEGKPQGGWRVLSPLQSSSPSCYPCVGICKYTELLYIFSHISLMAIILYLPLYYFYSKWGFSNVERYMSIWSDVLLSTVISLLCGTIPRPVCCSCNLCVPRHGLHPPSWGRLLGWGDACHPPRWGNCQTLQSYRPGMCKVVSRQVFTTFLQSIGTSVILPLYQAIKFHPVFLLSCYF